MAMRGGPEPKHSLRLCGPTAAIQHQRKLCKLRERRPYNAVDTISMYGLHTQVTSLPLNRVATRTVGRRIAQQRASGK
jgi:hypothetical protein